MTQLNRRSMLADVAAVPTAAAVTAFPGLGLVKSAKASGLKLYDAADLFMYTLVSDLYAPEMPKGSIIMVSRKTPPRDDGDLVLATIHWNSGEPDTQMLTSYTRHQGYDYNGRFCPPGCPQEVVASIAPIKYSREDLARCVTIDGVMVGWMRQDFYEDL